MNMYTRQLLTTHLVSGTALTKNWGCDMHPCRSVLFNLDILMNISEIPAGKGHHTANFPITNLANQHLKIHGEHLASSIIICDPDYTLIRRAHYF